MKRRLMAALLAAVVGAGMAAAAVVVSYHRPAEVVIELDGAVPAGSSGVFPPERAGDLTFAWTRKRATLTLYGIDRRVAAPCEIRLSGWRPAGTRAPELRLLADGATLVSRPAPQGYEDVVFEVAAHRGAADLTVAIEVSDTFKPGTEDRRNLGVAIDRIACRQGAGAPAWPPTRALAGAALAAAVLGSSVAAVGVSLAAAAGAASAAALAGAYLLSLGLAGYTAYPSRLWALALGISLALLLGVAVTRRVKQNPLTATARFVWVFSAIVLFLKLAALQHPSKATVDVVFQAHRFEWVLDGRLFFTSLTPSLYQFPYGISLYLVAAPFSWTTSDYPLLLRIVTCASEAAAGLLLYLMAVRIRGDRLLGAVTVVLFHAAPISYGVIGDGNLTNAFGEHLALATVAAVTLASLRSPFGLSTMAVGALAALAFVSHFGTFVLLATTLLAIAALYRLAGGVTLRQPGHAVLVVIGIGVVLATAGFYGHFGTVYEAQVGRILQESRASSESAAKGAIQETDMGAPGFEADLQDLDPEALAVERRKGAELTAARLARPLGERLSTAFVPAIRRFGAPLLLLALAGIVSFVRSRQRDRLVFAVGGWTAMSVSFILLGVFTPIRMRYFLAAVPAVALLAGAGGAWLWRAGRWGRGTAAVLWAWSMYVAIQAWLNWLEV